ncbi:MAG: TAXI family TRAP transporter solute-binding subunit [Methylocystaceae bacterium]|nr:TAXI family TRAP transporter solute-binding subunit [Methylocystaceae bacterium]
MVRTLFFLFAFSLSLISQPFVAQAQTKTIRIATGSETGLYYPIGQTICGWINEKTAEHNLICEAITTEGSVENARGLDKKKFDFALVQSDVQMYALNGIKTFSKERSLVFLRSLLSLHGEPLHLMISAQSNIKNFDDLKGKKISLGSLGSGSHTLAELILKEKGWKNTSFEQVLNLGTPEQMDALCKGTIDAAFWVAGLGNAAMRTAAKDCDIKLINITGEWVRILMLDNRQYVKIKIPAKTYVTSSSPIQTFGPKASLLTNADLDRKIVYLMMQTIFEHFEQLKSLHPALKNLDKKEMLEDGVIAPFHPAAMDYIMEKGLLR